VRIQKIDDQSFSFGYSGVYVPPCRDLQVNSFPKETLRVAQFGQQFKGMVAEGQQKSLFPVKKPQISVCASF
jgi:hypothetical protein